MVPGEKKAWSQLQVLESNSFMPPVSSKYLRKPENGLSRKISFFEQMDFVKVNCSKGKKWFRQNIETKT